MNGRGGTSEYLIQILEHQNSSGGSAMNRRGLWCGVLLSASMLLSSNSMAGETNARDYLPAPPGTTLMLTYAKHITADKIYNDGEETDGFNYRNDLGFFRLVYFNTLFGMPIDYQGLLFFNDQDLDGAAVGGNQFSSSGIMDPVLVSTIWPIANNDSKTYLGFTQYVTVPIGEYDGDGALNPGENRWIFKEEFGFMQGIGDKTFFEVQPSVEFYTDNDDVGGANQEKDPLFQLQMHLSYDVTPKFFVSGDYTYQYGAETTVAGISQDNCVESHKAGLSFNYKLSDVTQLLIEYSSTLDTENGPDVNIAGLRFLYIF